MAHAGNGHGEIDTAAVATVAGDLTGSRVRDVRALTGGISNLTYIVRLAPPADREAVVVRVFADRDRARAETAALRILDGTDVPAPQLLGHGRIRPARWFVVSTRLRGRPVARPDDPTWLDGLAETLVAIHGVSRHGHGLALDPGPARAWIDDGPSPESPSSRRCGRRSSADALSSLWVAPFSSTATFTRATCIGSALGLRE